MVEIEIIADKEVLKIKLTPGEAINFGNGKGGTILALIDSELIECSYGR